VTATSTLQADDVADDDTGDDWCIADGAFLRDQVLHLWRFRGSTKRQTSWIRRQDVFWPNSADENMWRQALLRQAPVDVSARYDSLIRS